MIELSSGSLAPESELLNFYLTRVSVSLFVTWSYFGEFGEIEVIHLVSNS